MMRQVIKKVIILTFVVTILVSLLAGCNSRETAPHAYDVYDTTDTYVDNLKGDDGTEISFFASDLCIGGEDNSPASKINAQYAETAAVFCIDDKEITYAKNIYQKRYPASTTKIMTAYLALKYGDPDQILTVSDAAIDTLDPASSVCGLRKGDRISLHEALYGLMLASGNDAANVIAEGISGSTEAFCDLMNREAYALGATDSHFVNPSGLPDPEHYTTAYDLYLIFDAALKIPEFIDIISSTSHDTTYESADGTSVSKKWVNTNCYLDGTYEVPEGITVIGGKTGTTKEAGNCLVLYSKAADQQPVISIVLKGNSKKALYQLMSEMLLNFSN